MANTSVSPPAVAGLFYPAEARTLSAQIQRMLARLLRTAGLALDRLA